MSVNSVTKNRLIEERKAWRKNRPFGFIAKPKIGTDGYDRNIEEWSFVVVYPQV
jgi:ubiquitin-protein ligase